MFGRLKQMLIKELIQVVRDKRTRFILIGPPIIQMLVFGYAANFEIHNVSTVVVDMDHSQESRELISRMNSSTRARPRWLSKSMPALRKSCAMARQRRCR
jgi:ABC-2 type transport system permease protein